MQTSEKASGPSFPQKGSPEKLICLGIEGTAHTAGVGIVRGDGKILSNLSTMFRPAQGGIHPREAANHHALELPGLISGALEDAGCSAGELGLVAFSQGPGLGPCLRTAATAARAVALVLDIPIMGVNHCIAHLEIGRLQGCTDPVLLYASGGNTQVIAFSRHRYRVFGETLDIGIGNMLDKIGRELGMPFPAGPGIERMAGKGKFIGGGDALPYSVKGMDMAFSGMATAALALRKRGFPLEDVCHSVQETAFAMLTEVTERAMAHTGKNEVLLGGGVVRNRRLQEMVRIMAEARGARFFSPRPELCVDNGAMIAWLGIIMSRAGEKMDIEDTAVRQNFRTDAVEVTWR